MCGCALIQRHCNSPSRHSFVWQVAVCVCGHAWMCVCTDPKTLQFTVKTQFCMVPGCVCVCVCMPMHANACAHTDPLTLIPGVECWVQVCIVLRCERIFECKELTVCVVMISVRYSVTGIYFVPCVPSPPLFKKKFSLIYIYILSCYYGACCAHCNWCAVEISSLDALAASLFNLWMIYMLVVLGLAEIWNNYFNTLIVCL